MPIEIELLIAAWDNAKKNAGFDGEGLEIDPETGEVIAGAELPDAFGELIAEIDDRMSDLVSHYRDNEVANGLMAEQTA